MRTPEERREYNRLRIAAWRKANPEKNEHRKKVARFGLSEAGYEAMAERQGGVCAICGRPERTLSKWGPEPRRLCIDHDHATLAVRGLLCYRCNTALGYFGDDPSCLERAAAYLRGVV